MIDSQDSVLRAITDDGGFRVMVAGTTATVREIARLQQVSGAAARQLAELMTGTILVRETMAPQYRVQGILRGSGGRGSIVVDAHPDGTNRGLVRIAEGSTEVVIGPDAMLQVMRTLMSGQIHQGVVSLEGSKSLSDALMKYMQTSEQVTSVIDVACQVEQDRIVAAGGYLVQLLPEVAEPLLAVMTERLRLFDPVVKLLREGKASPRDLVAELLYGMPHHITGESALRFECRCSHLRIMAGLSTLDRTEIESLCTDGEALEISCDFCGKQYRVTPEHLRGLLDGN
jgi:molecular chaperone Hsp33